LVEDFDNWEKLNGFYSLLNNFTYDIGHYVKKVELDAINGPTHLLGTLFKFCPIVEEFEFYTTEETCDYISSVQKTNKNLWFWESCS
jgi:hypothetical protein